MGDCDAVAVARDARGEDVLIEPKHGGPAENGKAGAHRDDDLAARAAEALLDHRLHQLRLSEAANEENEVDRVVLNERLTV